MLEPQFDLQEFNTLAVPSTAEFFSVVDDRESLGEMVGWARREGKKIHILGEGSNVLLPEFVAGLVLAPRLRQQQVLGRHSDEVVLRLGAGENWHQTVCWALEQGHYGLENLALIPGTVGAAPIQNIGAYGVELSELMVGLQALDLVTGQERWFTAEDCQFGYRDSVFKHSLKERFIILSVDLKLSTQPASNVVYPALRQVLDTPEPSPQEVFEAVCRIRRAKLPDPSKIPNCGSFFKNPIVELDQWMALSQRFPDLASFDTSSKKHKKLAAAWLIDKAGWKGRQLAGVRVHDLQALVLCNPEKRGLKDVLELAEKIRSSVQTTFGVALEIEPQTFLMG